MTLSRRQLVKVSSLDQAYAGNTAAYLVGPLKRPDSPTRLRARLKSVARGGPGNRIGLTPDPSTRWWLFDPELINVTISEGADLDLADPAVALATLERKIADVGPLHIHVAGRWLLIKFDHGLGGGRLFTELLAAIGSDSSGFAAPPPQIGCKNPGMRAAIDTVLRHPVRSVASLGETRGKRVASDTRSSQNGGGDVHISYARSGDQFYKALRQARGHGHTNVSTTAIITAQFLRYLDGEGISSESRVSIVVDQGRYLPPGTGTLSNFLAMAPIDVAPPYRAADISATLECYTSGVRSLTRRRTRRARIRSPGAGRFD